MRLTIDTNVLIYTFADDPQRSPVAHRIVQAIAGLDVVLTVQVLGEFINVTRRKYPDNLEDALFATEIWSLVADIASTRSEHLIAAARLAEHHQAQFWDSLILTVAADAGAQVLLSEDLQDGAAIGGVRVLNPFLPGNAQALATLLTPGLGTD